MALLIAAAILVCLALLGAFAYRRLSSPTVLPVTAEWIDELSVDRYRPMMRLLQEDDLRFLRTRPDFKPEMAVSFRRERCRVFRGYLRCLHGDFQRVSMALKIVMVQSRYDRPDLASALVRSQRAFALGMILVHCRLVLYRFGLATVDVADLLKVFDGARLELRSLVPASMTMAA